MSAIFRVRITISCVLFLSLGVRVAPAQAANVPNEFPNRLIRMIVPFPAGGFVDQWAQLLAEPMAADLKRLVITENHPELHGTFGTQLLAAAMPDGYTVIIDSTGPLALHPFTYRRVSYDVDRDLAPVALLESSPVILVAGPGFQGKDLKDLVAMAKAQPGGVRFASNGNGSPDQVAAEYFSRLADIKMEHVAFDGAGPARKGLAAANVAIMFDATKAVVSKVKEGRLKALAVASSKRLSVLPDVPTFAELGFPKMEMTIWTGVLAPAGTPSVVIERLNRAVQSALVSPDVEAKLAAEGCTTGGGSPDDFARFIHTEQTLWSRLAKATGIEDVVRPWP